MVDSSTIRSPADERRVALKKRRRVAEMSPEEMRRALLTSEVTGLPNRRAFDEASRSLAVAICDVDGLKALNQYGYEAGNAVLRGTAEALLMAELDAYHDKGDEFFCRGRNQEELRAKLERARTVLQSRTAIVERVDGSSLSIRGVDFSFGVGQDIHEAESRLKSHKANRENAGQIARGELRGIEVRTHQAGIFVTIEASSPDCLDLS